MAFLGFHTQKSLYCSTEKGVVVSLQNKRIGGFSRFLYWTSTESDMCCASSCNFSNGYNLKYCNKDNYVRPVRTVMGSKTKQWKTKIGSINRLTLTPWSAKNEWLKTERLHLRPVTNVLKVDHLFIFTQFDTFSLLNEARTRQ